MMERNVTYVEHDCMHKDVAQTFTDVLVVAFFVQDMYLIGENHVGELDDVENLMGAPPRESFLKVWDQVTMNGTSDSKKQLDSVGSREKVRKLQVLLSEARRERKLKFLESSEVICLLRDERKKRLLVRFRAARWHQGRVEVMAGILWQIRDIH